MSSLVVHVLCRSQCKCLVLWLCWDYAGHSVSLTLWLCWDYSGHSVSLALWLCWDYSGHSVKLKVLVS